MMRSLWRQVLTVVMVTAMHHIVVCDASSDPVADTCSPLCQEETTLEVECAKARGCYELDVKNDTDKFETCWTPCWDAAGQCFSLCAESFDDILQKCYNACRSSPGENCISSCFDHSFLDLKNHLLNATRDNSSEVLNLGVTPAPPEREPTLQTRLPTEIYPTVEPISASTLDPGAIDRIVRDLELKYRDKPSVETNTAAKEEELHAILALLASIAENDDILRLNKTLKSDTSQAGQAVLSSDFDGTSTKSSDLHTSTLAPDVPAGMNFDFDNEGIDPPVISDISFPAISEDIVPDVVSENESIKLPMPPAMTAPPDVTDQGNSGKQSNAVIMSTSHGAGTWSAISDATDNVTKGMGNESIKTTGPTDSSATHASTQSLGIVLLKDKPTPRRFSKLRYILTRKQHELSVKVRNQHRGQVRSHVLTNQQTVTAPTKSFTVSASGANDFSKTTSVTHYTPTIKSMDTPTLYTPNAVLTSSVTQDAGVIENALVRNHRKELDFTDIDQPDSQVPPEE